MAAGPQIRVPVSADSPHGLAELLDRVGPLFSLGDELGPQRALARTIPIEPLEASVSLGARTSARDMRVTIGLPSRADDPESRTALGAMLGALGVGSAADPAAHALELAARGARERRYA
jgi:hypothetical protein